MQNSYRALAIRYRPRKLEDLVGHESIVTTISNAIVADRFHHAILLTGTRGVGKTTIARIMATSLNCTNNNSVSSGIPGSPCLECDNCKQIIKGSHPDVIEFDAASHTGVDSIREIIDNCAYPPMSAKYKIYIIDEVHMLSKGAFNALLKTVEEPHKHLKFFFATTEVKKVPITILSRCQKFVLRNLSVEQLSQNIINISQKEGFTIELEAADMIAAFSKGSVRDSLSILDQVLSISLESGVAASKGISVEHVKNAISIPEEQIILELFGHVLCNDIKSAIKCVEELSLGMQEIEQVVTQMMSVIVKLCKKITIKTQLSFELEQFIQQYNENLNIGNLMRMWQTIAKFQETVKYVGIDFTVGMEMLCIQLAAMSLLPTPKEIVDFFAKNTQPSKSYTSVEPNSIANNS